mgnify:CR=1 FL=1
MDTKKMLSKVVKELSEDSIINSPKCAVDKIPTLEKDVYRSATPMLKERFAKIGSWLDSTYGDWLDIDEMKSFWNNDSQDSRVRNIIHNIEAAIDNWEDDAA